MPIAFETRHWVIGWSTSTAVLDKFFVCLRAIKARYCKRHCAAAVIAKATPRRYPLRHFPDMAPLAWLDGPLARPSAPLPSGLLNDPKDTTPLPLPLIPCSLYFPLQLSPTSSLTAMPCAWITNLRSRMGKLCSLAVEIRLWAPELIIETGNSNVLTTGSRAWKQNLRRHWVALLRLSGAARKNHPGSLAHLALEAPRAPLRSRSRRLNHPRVVGLHLGRVFSQNSLTVLGQS